MPLASLFTQRVIGSTTGSMRSRVPLRTPSGAQSVESALEKELLLQIDFSQHVVDVITQPSLEYEVDGAVRTYTPDVFLELGPGLPFQSRYYLIEVKRQEDLEANSEKYERKFAAAREWCRNNVGEFRIVTDRQIRAPYLGNAQLLRPLTGQDPEDRIIDAYQAALAQRPMSVGELRDVMQALGMSYLEANAGIRIAVANAFVRCDLSIRFSDDAMLSLPTWESVHDHKESPVLRMIMEAKSQLEQAGNKML